MEPAPKRRFFSRQRRRAILLVLLVPLGALAWQLFGPTPNVRDVPILLLRNAGGVFARQQDEPPGAWLELRAAKLYAQDSVSSSSSEIRTGECRLAFRRMAIFAGSDHPLMIYVGHDLADRLTALPDLEEIRYYPLDQAPTREDTAPDVWIQLGMGELEESWVPFSRSLRTTVTFRVGGELVESRPSVRDSLTPPVVQYVFSGQLGHESKTTGIVTASARYKLAAADVATELGKAIQKYLIGLREDDGLLPELPSSFYPEYREPPEIPLGPWFEPVLSVHGLMASSETLWSQEPPPNLEGFLDDLVVRFREHGWSVDSPRAGGEAIRDLRLTRDSTTLLVFSADRPSRGTELWAKLTVRMTPEELGRAIDETLRPESPDELLLLFHRQWSPEQRSTVRELLARRPPTSPLGWISLARIRADDGDKTGAVDALGRGTALLRTLPQPGPFEDKLEGIAKELEAQEVVRAPPSSQILTEQGFAEIEPESRIPAREVSAEEPATWFLRRKDGEVDVITVRVIVSTPPGGSPSPSLSHVVSQGRTSRAWGTSDRFWSTALDSGIVLSVTAQPVDDSGRFRLEVQADTVAQD